MAYIIAGIGVLFTLFVFWKKNFPKEEKQCFSQENFDKTILYTRWKQRTSKIGKVLVNGYRVEVSEGNEILFKEDKKDYTIFKVNREAGIILLPVKQSSSLKRKADNAFCELLERALFHPILPDNK